MFEAEKNSTPRHNIPIPGKGIAEKGHYLTKEKY
jgi:hypothetical protein